MAHSIENSGWGEESWSGKGTASRPLEKEKEPTQLEAAEADWKRARDEYLNDPDHKKELAFRRAEERLAILRKESLN